MDRRRRRLGHDLLREHVERPLGDPDGLEHAAPEPAHDRRALDELVAAHREEPSLRHAPLHVRRAPDPLQRDVERARRAELDDEVHVADVDAELEGGGRDDGAEAARLEPLLGMQPAGAGERAVVGRDLVLAEPLGERVGGPLREPPRVHEDERRAVRAHELGDPVVRLAPEVVRGDRRELVPRDLDAEVEGAAAPGLHDGAAGPPGAVGPLGADEEARHLLDRVHRRGEANPLGPAARERLEPLEREREVRAALVAGDRVDLVHDHRLDRRRAPPGRAPR